MRKTLLAGIAVLTTIGTAEAKEWWEYAFFPCWFYSCTNKTADTTHPLPTYNIYIVNAHIDCSPTGDAIGHSASINSMEEAEQGIQMWASHACIQFGKTPISSSLRITDRHVDVRIGNLASDGATPSGEDPIYDKNLDPYYIRQRVNELMAEQAHDMIRMSRPGTN